MHDLTQAERRALMAHLLTGRDTFATSQPRVAEWFSDRLCELDDDDIDEGALFDHLEGEW